MGGGSVTDTPIVSRTRATPTRPSFLSASPATQTPPYGRKTLIAPKNSLDYFVMHRHGRLLCLWQAVLFRLATSSGLVSGPGPQ